MLLHAVIDFNTHDGELLELLQPLDIIVGKVLCWESHRVASINVPSGGKQRNKM